MKRFGAVVQLSGGVFRVQGLRCRFWCLSGVGCRAQGSERRPLMLLLDTFALANLFVEWV